MRLLAFNRKLVITLAVTAALIGVGVAWAVRDPSGETDPKLARIAKLEAKQDVAGLSAAIRTGTPSESVRAVGGLAAVGATGTGRAAAEIREAARAAIRAALVDDARSEVRAAAARAAAATGSIAGVADLRAALSKDPEPDVRRAAANALGELMAWDGTTELVAAMDDDDALVRKSAFTAIFRITGAKFPYDTDDPPPQRRASMAAIQRLLPSLKPAHDEYVRRLGKS